MNTSTKISTFDTKHEGMIVSNQIQLDYINNTK